MGQPMRLKLTQVGLLVLVANHYANRGALGGAVAYTEFFSAEV